MLLPFQGMQGNIEGKKKLKKKSSPKKLSQKSEKYVFKVNV